MIQARSRLHHWYAENKRDLPWRSEPSPYRIWLSEIILQQTRVAQGMDYYLRFVDAFPTVFDLANAEEDSILKLWQGLGYYNRARNLHAAAKQVVTEHSGSFPDDYDGLLSLKGVGPYTAAAIASIAYHLPHAVVDGNVIRVLARVHGIEAPVDQGSTLKEIQNLANAFLSRAHPGDHNQAVMELGALVCTPRTPNCVACPLRAECKAHKLDLIDSIPIKSKKIKRRSRFFHYIIATEAGKTAIQQRGEKDIWAGLYQFPLIETTTDETLTDELIIAHLNLNKINVVRVNAVAKHVLSHQDIYTRFYHTELQLEQLADCKLVTLEELHTFALPRLIDRYLENKSLSEGKKRH